jgi:RNA polymerase sigma-70 factor (ECF subfamily)
MEQGTSQTLKVQVCLDRLREGDADARAELLSLAWDRFHHLARKLLKEFSKVRRWEETDDVRQRAAIRLERALTAKPPSSVKHFFRLAAKQIRRELIDLSRHYYGPEGMGGHHHTDGRPGGDEDSGRRFGDPVAATAGPATLAQWTEFHEAVERLPAEELEVFDLHYYTGLGLKDVAETLGISEKTAKRRWRSARLLLHEAIKGRHET